MLHNTERLVQNTLVPAVRHTQPAADFTPFSDKNKKALSGGELEKMDLQKKTSKAFH